MQIQFQHPPLTVFESALFRTTSTVIETPELILVVDPNCLPREIEFIQRHVQQIRGDRPVFLLFTHSDWDHIIGYRAFDGAQVIAAQAFADNPSPGKSLDDIRRFDDEYYIRRPYPIEYPRVDKVIHSDGQTLEFGDTRLVFYLAPGHTADGLFTVVEPYGIWLAGDYLSNMEFPFVYHSFSEYLHTLSTATDLLQNHAIRLLVPGHGDVTTDKSTMQSRIDESEQYLRRVVRAASNDNAFDEEFFNRFPFPLMLQKYHRENLELARRETGQG
ncbi:MAG: MBL fold metallo-hydrolase [Lewinellaceae bacterium]|nr:MBL fold metallo-hydrolase [Lewinellaceae bacterium]